MLAVLDEPFVFTQRAALTLDGLAKELRDRFDVWPEQGQLEAFHRAGLLVPIYAIRYDPRLVRSRALAEGRQLDREEIRTALDFTNTQGPGLLRERGIGDLESPVDYRPWRRQHGTFAGRRYRTVQYLYSYYQLLATPTIKQLWPRLRGRWGKTWKLQVSEPSLEYHRLEVAWVARLVQPLTVLEPIYLPDIFESVSMPELASFDDYDRFRAAFDPAVALKLIGWPADEVLKTAEGLLARGHGIDRSVLGMT